MSCSWLKREYRLRHENRACNRSYEGPLLVSVSDSTGSVITVFIVLALAFVLQLYSISIGNNIGGCVNLSVSVSVSVSLSVGVVLLIL